jgi:hypothetical protein
MLSKRSIIYCWKCGKKLYDDAAFCSSCGAKANASENVEAANSEVHQSVDDPESIQSAVASPSKYMEQAQKQNMPVGGWLLLLCIIITIFTPLYMPIKYNFIFGFKINSIIGLIAAIMFFLNAVLSLIIGIRLWLGKPDAVIETKVLIVFELLSDALFVIIAVPRDLGYIAARFVIIAPSVLYFTLVWIYLSISKRVKLFYS